MANLRPYNVLGRRLKHLRHANVMEKNLVAIASLGSSPMMFSEESPRYGAATVAKPIMDFVNLIETNISPIPRIENGGLDSRIQFLHI